MKKKKKKKKKEKKKKKKKKKKNIEAEKGRKGLEKSVDHSFLGAEGKTEGIFFFKGWWGGMQKGREKWLKARKRGKERRKERKRKKSFGFSSVVTQRGNNNLKKK